MQEVLGSIGIDLTLDQFKEISLRRGESTFVLATEQGITADDVDQLREERDRLYAELMEAQSCVIDGVEEVLRVLHGQVRMGVVTSARRQHFEAAHEKSGLIQYMDFVLTREDYTQSKPHPEPYLTAMKRHGLRPTSASLLKIPNEGWRQLRRQAWTASSCSANGPGMEISPKPLRWSITSLAF